MNVQPVPVPVIPKDAKVATPPEAVAVFPDADAPHPDMVNVAVEAKVLSEFVATTDGDIVCPFKVFDG